MGSAAVRPKTLTACICIPKKVTFRCVLSYGELIDVDLSIRILQRSIGTNQEIIKLQVYPYGNLDIDKTMVETLNS